MSGSYSASHYHGSFPSEGCLPAPNSPRIREVYISPYKDSKDSLQQLTASSSRFIKIEQPPEAYPPKAAPFRRSSRVSSKDREKSGELKSFRNLNQSLERKEGSGRIASLEKKLHHERVEGEKWKKECASKEEKLKSLTEQLSKSREERQALHGELLTLRDELEQSERTNSKFAEQVQSLSRALRESKVNQKSLANLKNLQNQIELLQLKNAALAKENEELGKGNKKIKGELHKRKEYTSESEVDQTKREEKVRSLQMEVKRLKEQLGRDRSQREALLQTNLHLLQRKLYEKENEIKRISIQLNCLDRRKYISIDEVKAKKDQEIKDLRQRFNKVNKDLKETRNKIEQNELRRGSPKSPFVRKIKSSQLLGATSESEEVTFEFSSEA